MDNETVAVYNRQVDEYVELTGTETPDPALIAFIDRIAPGGRVLDLGCGPGASAAAMQAAGLDVEATDASAEMVRVAREQFNLNARVATFQDDFQDGKNTSHYDGIWANFSLLHATREEFIEILPRLHRALKPNGYLFLGMKTGTDSKRDKLGRLYTYYADTELVSLLNEANFTIVDKQHGEAEGMAGDIEPFMLITSQAR